MRMILFLFFFMTLVALGSFFSFSVFKIYGVFRNQLLHKIVLSLYVFLPIIFIATNVVGMKTYSKINSFFYTISAVWIGALLYLFIGALLLALGYFFIKNLNPLYLQYIGTTLFVCALGVVSFSIYNASNPKVTTFNVKVPKLATLWKDKKIVLFSDTHLGNVRGQKFTQKVVDLVNAQKPDLVLMAGDMIDGPIIPYEQFAKPFKDIRSTYGTYYTPGNHEWYNVEPEKFINVMKNFTSELIDKKMETNGTDIIGINYMIESEVSTKERLLATGFKNDKPSIAIMHDPKNNDTLIKEGVSLVVSGHTHCGQFWPVNYIVRSIYKDKTYGVRQLGDQATITTCGIGTALAPFRLGNNPEIVVINVIE